MFLVKMSNLAQLLAAGTARFNALRKKGEVASDHSGTTLSGLFFARANLSKLDLSNAELEDCTVSEVDFAESDLRGAFIHGGRYEKCDFRGANLEGATLEHVEFVECDFTGVVGLGTLELEEVKGLGPSVVEARDLEEAPRFTPGHVAVNEALEQELDAHPDDEKRWLVYADWLQAEGDMRGELITRHHRGSADEFHAFVNDHLDQLFGDCADEILGGGQIPELELEWRHGFVVGATLSSVNAERAVNLGEVVKKLLPLPVCRFIRRLSFGLNHGVTLYGENTNDYASVVNALITQPRLARIERLEFGVQEPEIDEDYGEPEPLHAWGDLSALWPHVPQLRELLVKGSEGILGELVLPELRSVSLVLEVAEDAEVFSEVLAAKWPKLERFELSTGAFELEPLLHVLSTLPLEHLGLPNTHELGPLLEALVKSPVLKGLEVLDLHHSTLRGPTFEWLVANLRSFSHLKRLDLTGAADPHEEEALSRMGEFIVIRPPEVAEEEPRDLEDWEEPDPTPEEAEAPEAPNADLDIPDEHGD